jgi:hypothetical protein
MSKVQVGSIIKSYDFPGTFNCYMVGKVTAVDGDFISCDKIKQVFDGKQEEINEFNNIFRTLAQGTGAYDDKFERVVVIA